MDLIFSNLAFTYSALAVYYHVCLFKLFSVRREFAGVGPQKLSGQTPEKKRTVPSELNTEGTVLFVSVFS